MKRYVAGILAAVLSLSVLAGCGGAKSNAADSSKPAAQSQTPTLDKIKKDGKLVIGTSPDYPPYESLDTSNKPIGFDMDIMAAVAKKLGVKLEIVQIGFDGLIPALQAKKFDIMAAGVSVTDERKQVVDFTEPYVIGSDSIVLNKANIFPVTKLEDLKGKKVAVQIGTVQADALHKIPGIDVKEYNLYTEAAEATASKQADALYVATVVAKAFVAANPDKLQDVFQMKAKDTAYALRKDTPDLTNFVNGVLEDMKKDGEMDTLVKKWFK